MSRLIKACEVQPGDTVRDHWFTGEIEHDMTLPVHKITNVPDGRIFLATKSGAGFSFDPIHKLTLLDRPTPQLPTEPGSVITAYEVRGVRSEDGWTLMLCDIETSWAWASSNLIDGYRWHDPEDITDWRPFPDPEAVTTNKETKP